MKAVENKSKSVKRMMLYKCPEITEICKILLSGWAHKKNHYDDLHELNVNLKSKSH